jgi:hypothetical protein
MVAHENYLRNKLSGNAKAGGGGKVIRYNPDTRPPWLPNDIAWEGALFSKAPQRLLALMYSHSSKNLRELVTQDLRQSEALH